ncbi:unnamed protein product [Alternaria alternata]
MLYFITTKDGRKYHLTTNAGMRGSEKLGSFISINDLTEKKSRGNSILEQGSGNPQVLAMKSVAQSVISPVDGDKWTGTHHTLALSGVRLDTILKPTGGNFYYGGGGGIQLMGRGPDPDYSTSLPGWSWYWVSSPYNMYKLLVLKLYNKANPTTRVSGTLTVDDVEYEIDTEQSFALFERQWGNFQVGKGYVALWLFLETGEVLNTWCMEPDVEGVTKVAFASVWHPNGLHEMIPVGPDTRFSGAHTSPATGLAYFTTFFLDLPARNACFTFNKWFQDGELEPVEEQRNKYITIMESYGEGEGQWGSEGVKFYGHVEQLQLDKISW